MPTSADDPAANADANVTRPDSTPKLKRDAQIRKGQRKTVLVRKQKPFLTRWTARSS